MKRITADSTFTKKHGLNFYQGATRYCKHCGTPLFRYFTDELGNARQPMHLEVEDKTGMHYECYVEFETNMKKEYDDMKKEQENQEAKKDAEFDMDEYARLHKLPDEVLSKARKEDSTAEGEK